MLGIGVDWVALSFVQQPADIEEILELIDQHLPEGAFRPAVMAKIEKPSCFLGDNLERIVDLCDGISKFLLFFYTQSLIPQSCSQNNPMS
jgi:pyruvate kinase